MCTLLFDPVSMMEITMGYLATERHAIRPHKGRIHDVPLWGLSDQATGSAVRHA